MEKHLMIRSADEPRVATRPRASAQRRLSTSVESAAGKASRAGARARAIAYAGAMRRTSTMTLARCLAVAGAVAVATTPQAWGATTAKDRRFVSARHGITVDAPTGWTLSTHTGFPNILVLLLHPDGSRISVAVSDTQAATARALADSNRRGLEVQGLKIVGQRAGARDGVEIEAQSSARAETVIQLYLVRELGSAAAKQAIIISLITATASLATHRPALDQVVAKLGLNPVADAVPARPPSSKAPSAAQRPTEEQRR